ncbi:MULTISPECIES: TonB-dependent receptor [unclassified Novosphingobium]|uniref:TonB-dependent receptor n=1 Tax=unclassified Novosphingobium TaxID=2644732 RepID=UPI0014451575|nr:MULTISPECIES: TonB-dependent receptor [unclassified Novosphingobium]NKJ42405.1 iron complex outermembrane receptor protein [Novosphingobium sp. SG720]NMN04792.1 iron complex outermembrane receptor protein [Novosphingobium sp. SG919]NMN85214.1 iron complex outermembrane receptor protein [Novosphingobium sp. SG916]
MKMHYLTAISAAALTAATLAPTTALAQAAPQADASDTLAPNEITVTARKRNETAQTVADPISVVTAAKIANSDLRTLQDAVRLTPNLVVLDGLYPGYKTVSFRGFTTLGRDGEFPFATVVDGVVQPGQMFFQQELVNVSQIEILRGPQGTLYGGGAIAGAINIVTRKPTNDFTGSVSAQYLSGNEKRAIGSISGPIVKDKLYFTFGATAYKGDGLIKNLANPLNADFGEGVTTRGSLIFTPTADFTLALSASTTDSKVGGLWLAPVPDVDFRDTVPNPSENQPGIVRTKLRAYSLKGDWTIPNFATLTAITAYSRGRDYTTADGDFSAADNYTQNVFFLDETWSQELRLTSNGAGPLKWNVGGYYQDERRFYTSNYGYAGNPPVFFSHSDTKRTYKTFALFGQVSYQITDRVELTGGFRYDWEHQTYDDLDPASTGPKQLKQKFSEPQGKASVSYKWSPDLFTYASYSRGYRKGGFNPSSAEMFLTYKPETADNYELGFKSNLAGSMVTLNGALFYTDFRGQQFSTSRVVEGVGIYTAISNINKTQVLGAEAELTIRPTRGLSLSGSVGYSDVKIKSYLPEDPDTYYDHVIPQIYRFTAQAGIDYEAPLSDAFTLVVHGDMAHRGNVYWDVANSLETGPKTFFNAKVTLQRGAWSLSAIGRNLSNERTPMAVGAHAYGTSTLASYNAPRQYGVELGVKF